jgi:bla regulator protein BlaR1
MIPHSLSEIFATIAPALGNHLWQSTIFTCGAALLTLSLRKNRARARYWLWLAASLKFLIPFSLLVGIGSHLAWSHQAATPKRDLYFAMQQASEPFTPSGMFQAAPAAPSAALRVLFPALLAVWVIGFVVVVFVWSVRWRRVSASIREAAPLREGCEVNTLRRLEQAASSSKPIQMLASPTSLEPGIFGIVRPVLIWPRSISERLDNAHLEAILAHELCHVRRRDNLAAAIHMFVEAVFWFHPMVWWLGSRLLDERERACDEEVLDSGRDRQVYAESILKICEFCVGSPLPCVAAVTGADLKRRIARIMSEQIARKLDFSRKLLLCAAIILAVTAPIVGGALHLTPSPFSSQTQNTIAAAPAYATVSIVPNNSGGDRNTLMFGPDQFISKNASLQQVIREAYGVEDDRIAGAPDWLSSEKYDVEAKEASFGSDDPRARFDQSVSKQKRMLQALLADRLKLAVHHETREIPVFALVLAKDGPKLHESQPGANHPDWYKGPDGNSMPGIWMKPNALVGQGIGMGPLLLHLSRQLHHTVLDETGLSGTYDFTLNFPDGVRLGIDNPVPPESYEPAVSTAIEQQLGLKLELKKVPLEVLVIDHVEKPLGN